jgi:hypothetical protein
MGNGITNSGRVAFHVKPIERDNETDSTAM